MKSIFSGLAIPEDYRLLDYCKVAGMEPRSYQRPVLEAMDAPGVEHVVICGIPQTGKSRLVELAVERLLSSGGLGDLLAVFPVDSLADEMSERLDRTIKTGGSRLGSMFQESSSSVKDGEFVFATRKLKYQTAGTDIVALPYRFVWASEIDRWQSSDSVSQEDGSGRKKTEDSSAIKGRDNLFEVKNRVRSWRGRGGLTVFDCTPSLESYPIWREFLNGSQGFFHLQCLGCRLPTIRSCDFSGVFGFQRRDDGDPIDGTERLRCPECGREHVEDEAEQMAAGGVYVHARPDRLPRRPSFQWGALAAPQVIRWREIADAIVRGGWSGSFTDQKYLDNGFRGLPIQSRHRPKTSSSFAKLSIDWRPTDKTRCLLMSIDTQDDRFKWVIRAYDDGMNSDMVAAGFSRSVDHIREAFRARYHGLGVMCGLWDVGGHRSREVERAVASTTGMYMYKGDSKAVQFGMDPHFRMSENVSKLILANPYWYQSEFLHRLYQQPKPETWATCREYTLSVLPADKLPDTYCQEIEAMQPGKGVSGGEYRNWAPKGGEQTPHDYFDAEKMNLCLLDFSLQNVPAKTHDGKPVWIGGKKPLSWMRAQVAKLAASSR